MFRALTIGLKWVGLFAALVVLALPLFVAERLSWFAGSRLPLSGHMTNEAIEGPVTITRDRNAVPHIRGSSDADIYFGIGFAHAQDRLWQMAFFRRLLEGRLAELIGFAGVKPDMLIRSLAVESRARSSFAVLSPEARGALEAYAAGVNAWVSSNRTHLPPEFQLTMSGFEPWEPHHSLMILKLLGLGLSNNAFQEMQRVRLIDEIGVDRTAELFPPYPEGAPVTLRDATKPLQRAGRNKSDLALAWFAQFGGASNNWVVDGRLTKTGLPLLANDPHLGLSAPGVWYLAHFELPGGHVAGGTIPGLPVIILGHNEYFAWGLTTTHADTQDLVIETIDPADERRYLTPDEPKAFATWTEDIRVRFGKTISFEARATRHGPVLPPVFDAIGEVTGSGAVLSIATPALDPEDRSFEAALAMMKARDPNAITRASRSHVAPMQNIVYANADGDIGFIAPARVPIRHDKAASGLLPVDGKAVETMWQGFIPFEGLPQTINPASGQIFTANNKIVDDDYPYLIAVDWPASHRADRIKALLSRGAPYEIADFERMMMDGYSPFAEELLPRLLAVAPAGPREETALTILRAWDCVMTEAGAAPLIFTAWSKSLQRALIADDLGALALEHRGVSPVFVTAILNGDPAAAHWCDDQTTPESETCDAIIAASLVKALDELSDLYGSEISAWHWGKAHIAVHAHMSFGQIPLIRNVFNREVEMGGGPFSLNRGDVPYSGARPYRSVHGAGFRAVYDFADLARSRFMISIGQSGNPLSPHYDDFLKPWSRGESFEIPLDADKYESGAIGTWVISPSTKAQPSVR